MYSGVAFETLCDELEAAGFGGVQARLRAVALYSELARTGQPLGAADLADYLAPIYLHRAEQQAVFRLAVEAWAASVEQIGEVEPAPESAAERSPIDPV